MIRLPSPLEVDSSDGLDQIVKDSVAAGSVCIMMSDPRRALTRRAFLRVTVADGSVAIKLGDYAPVIVYHIRSFVPLLVVHTARRFVGSDTYVLVSKLLRGNILRHTFRLSSSTRFPKLLGSTQGLC